MKLLLILYQVLPEKGRCEFNYSALVSMRWEKPLIHHNFFFHSACLLVHFEYFPKFIHYTCCCLTNSKSLPITFGSILASRAETSCGTSSSCKVSSRTGDCCCCEEDLHKQRQLELNKMSMKFESILSHSRKSWVPVFLVSFWFWREALASVLVSLL